MPINTRSKSYIRNVEFASAYTLTNEKEKKLFSFIEFFFFCCSLFQLKKIKSMRTNDGWKYKKVIIIAATTTRNKIIKTLYSSRCESRVLARAAFFERERASATWVVRNEIKKRSEGKRRWKRNNYMIEGEFSEIKFYEERKEWVMGGAK